MTDSLRPSPAFPPAPSAPIAAEGPDFIGGYPPDPAVATYPGAHVPPVVPTPEPVNSPDGLRAFSGDVPAGDSLIGVFHGGRQHETLYVVPTDRARSLTIVLNGSTLSHVDSGPDGRWQYGDNTQ